MKQMSTNKIKAIAANSKVILTPGGLAAMAACVEARRHLRRYCRRSGKEGVEVTLQSMGVYQRYNLTDWVWEVAPNWARAMWDRAETRSDRLIALKAWIIWEWQKR